MHRQELTPDVLRYRPSHEGRVVLVTGAARGIGRSVAQAFVERHATVIVSDLNAADVAEVTEALNALGHGRAVALACDVSDYAALEAGIGGLGLEVDTIINNAGISPKHDGIAHRIWEMDPAEWRRVLDVNLTGSFNTMRLLTPAMIKAGRGWIVNTSSVAGKTYMPIVASHYAATKSAVIGFTKHVAGELGPHGIRVNAVAPGRIATPMVAGVAPELNAEVVKLTPLGRLGLPEEVADVALWLTSSESSFVTGQTFDVAGGYNMA